MTRLRYHDNKQKYLSIFINDIVSFRLDPELVGFQETI
jgi:hypothetical protein